MKLRSKSPDPIASCILKTITNASQSMNISPRRVHLNTDEVVKKQNSHAKVVRTSRTPVTIAQELCPADGTSAPQRKPGSLKFVSVFAVVTILLLVGCTTEKQPDSKPVASVKVQTSKTQA